MATIVRATITPRAMVYAAAPRAARVSRPSAPAIAVRRETSKAEALGRRRETRRALTIVAAEGEDAPAPAAEPEVPAPAAPAVDPEAARIADMVAEIKDYLKLLYVKREMNFNEVRLTLAIEDPRLADRRERYGIEDESGVSADEKVEALEAIDAGEIPTDALVVETLLQDFPRMARAGQRGEEGARTLQVRRDRQPGGGHQNPDRGREEGRVRGGRRGREGRQPLRVPGPLRRQRRAHLHHHRRALHHVRQQSPITRLAKKCNNDSESRASSIDPCDALCRRSAGRTGTWP